jgi:hypothetical protein
MDLRALVSFLIGIVLSEHASKDDRMNEVHFISMLDVIVTDAARSMSIAAKVMKWSDFVAVVAIADKTARNLTGIAFVGSNSEPVIAVTFEDLRSFIVDAGEICEGEIWHVGTRKERVGSKDCVVVVVSSQIVRIVRAFRVVLKETSCCSGKRLFA